MRPHRDHHRSGLHDLAVDADAATVDIELAGGESDALAQHSPEPATSRTCSSRHHSFVRSAATLATAWTASKVGISTRVTARSTRVTSTSCQRRALEITESGATSSVAGSAPARRLLTRGETVGSPHYVRLDQLFVTLDIRRSVLPSRGSAGDTGSRHSAAA